MTSFWKHFSFAACLVVASSMSIAAVPSEQLQARLSQLEPLSEQGYDLDGLRREAGYELQDLPISVRARLEAENLYSKIQLAVLETFDNAISEGETAESALEIVREQIEADLQNIGSEHLRTSLKDFTEMVLSSNTTIDLTTLTFPDQLLTEFAENSRIRLETLSARQEVALAAQAGLKINKTNRGEKINPSAGSGLSTSSRGVRSYKSTSDILRALVSGDESERWVATANNSETAESGWEAEATVRVQPKFKFLGVVEVSGGPFVTATLTRFLTLDIKAEGTYPLTMSNGFFDLDWRDSHGNKVMRDGVVQRRFVFFTCSATMAIRVDAGVGATLSVAGVGGEAQAKRYKRFETNYSSRRALVPDTINGQKVGLAILTNICHNRFLDVRNFNNRTIRQNMRTSLQNMTKSLVLESSASQCARASQCNTWFNKKPRGTRLKTTPACVATGPSVMTCQLRGKVSARCAVIKNGKNLSSPGSLTCAKGLRCVQTREYVPAPVSWLPPLYYAVGVCRR